MTSSADIRPSPRVFPIRLVFCLLAGSIGLSLWLVPRQDELVERLFMDKQYERIAALLREGLGASSEADMGRLRTLSAEQLTALSQLLRLTPREQIRVIFGSSHPPAYDSFVHGLVLAAVRFVDVIPPAEAWGLVRPHLERMSPAQQLQLCDLLAHNAFAVKSPALAAEMLSHAASLPGAAWSTAREMAQAFRWSGQPGKGASALREWLVARGGALPPEEAAPARSLMGELALESGNPSLALDICLDELKSLGKDEAIGTARMDHALNLARQCSRTAEVIHWMERHVGSLPESRLDYAGLRQAARAEPAAGTMAEFQRFTRLLSQFSDWNSKFDAAFDHHAKLAALGDLASLDRVLALADFLGRDEDAVSLLEAVQPVPERPQARMALARMMAALGRDEDALLLYREWVAEHPEDRRAGYELGCLLEDMGNEDAAMQAFEAFMLRFPSDADGVKKLAESRLRAGQPEKALELYHHLPEGDHDLHTLESYAMLAESLDEHEALFRALKLTVAKQPRPTVELYLDLAEAAAQLDDSRILMDVLGKGIQRIPESAALRVALANAWLANDGYDEAFALITGHERMRENIDAVALALALAPRLPEPRRVLEFVGEDVDKRFPLPPGSRLDLAVLHRIAGDDSKAEALVASVPETLENRRMIAEARAQMGDHEEAARQMVAFLDSSARASASEWIFLGEIYEQMGRMEDAKKAYDYSLALLTADLPDTAFTQPRGVDAASP